jgi:hypothetical protein
MGCPRHPRVRIMTAVTGPSGAPRQPRSGQPSTPDSTTSLFTMEGSPLSAERDSRGRRRHRIISRFAGPVDRMPAMVVPYILFCIDTLGTRRLGYCSLPCSTIPSPYQAGPALHVCPPSASPSPCRSTSNGGKELFRQPGGFALRISGRRVARRDTHVGWGATYLGLATMARRAGMTGLRASGVDYRGRRPGAANWFVDRTWPLTGTFITTPSPSAAEPAALSHYAGDNATRVAVFPDTENQTAPIPGNATDVRG